MRPEEGDPRDSGTHRDPDLHNLHRGQRVVLESYHLDSSLTSCVARNK